ncbi:protein-glucosylgalactosylhydroxylysine glucosidase-like [Styela clava]
MKKHLLKILFFSIVICTSLSIALHYHQKLEKREENVFVELTTSRVLDSRKIDPYTIQTRESGKESRFNSVTIKEDLTAKTISTTWISNIHKIDPYIIQTHEPAKEDRFDPTVANGYVGYRVYGETIYKNGLYNGREGNSHRARIPGTLPYVVKSSSTFETNGKVYKLGSDNLYLLNMKLGFFSEKYSFIDENTNENNVLCSISQNFYAHKVLTRLLITEIIINFNSKGSVVLPLNVRSGNESQDIKFNYFNRKNFEASNAIAVCGNTLVPEQEDGKLLPVCYCSTDVPKNISLEGEVGEKYSFTFITSISDSLDEAKDFYILGLKLSNNGTLFSSHCNEWLKTWEYGSLLIKSGNITQMHSTVSGLYYLLSAFPPLSSAKHPYEFFGVSPGGLTNGGKDQDYLGHVFWDQDFWMLPALLPLFPEAVKHGIEYRVARLWAAKEKALNLGFRGAMYPWESAYTGLDVCPGISYVKYEQHVTGDLIHILRQYVYLTGDWDFLFQKIPDSRNNEKFVTPWDVIYETSVFWLSRTQWSEKYNAFVIDNVMGPDEYHSPVNNSAFTNEVALQNMDFAIQVADKYDLPLPEREHFKKVIEDMLIPYDDELDYHPEFTGYNHTTDRVKQADAIMLGFPLMSNNNSIISRKNDLTIYGNTTVSDGPAMTWSMFSINWNSMGEHSKADNYFLHQYNNIQLPYQIWSEEPSGNGAVNFLTGIGGYLQSILYGYLGLRIYSDNIVLNPRIPPGLDSKSVTSLHVIGLKFNCAVLDVIVQKTHFDIALKGFRNNKQCTVLLISNGSSHELSNIGDKYSLSLTICKIMMK